MTTAIKPGVFFLEGPDGSGKSTTALWLKDQLAGKGIPAEIIKIVPAGYEQDYYKLYNELVDYAGPAFIMLGALNEYFEHTYTRILRLLEEGKCVIVDRDVISVPAYWTENTSSFARYKIISDVLVDRLDFSKKLQAKGIFECVIYLSTSNGLLDQRLKEREAKEPLLKSAEAAKQNAVNVKKTDAVRKFYNRVVRTALTKNFDFPDLRDESPMELDTSVLFTLGAFPLVDSPSSAIFHYTHPKAIALRERGEFLVDHSKVLLTDKVGHTENAFGVGLKDAERLNGHYTFSQMIIDRNRCQRLYKFQNGLVVSVLTGTLVTGWYSGLVEVGVMDTSQCENGSLIDAPWVTGRFTGNSFDDVERISIIELESFLDTVSKSMNNKDIESLRASSDIGNGFIDLPACWTGDPK